MVKLVKGTTFLLLYHHNLILVRFIRAYVAEAYCFNTRESSVIIPADTDRVASEGILLGILNHSIIKGILPYA